VGFFTNLFFKTWLVRAHNVRSGDDFWLVVSRVIAAPTQADAEEKLRSYLISENFAFGKVEAILG
jgi:hypothetical protein